MTDKYEREKFHDYFKIKKSNSLNKSPEIKF